MKLTRIEMRGLDKGSGRVEDGFEILQVIELQELQPPETIKRIDEMVGVYLDRERMARIWG